MKFSVTLLGAALYLFASAEAGITTNSPFKSVTWNGGDNVKVIWDDDGQPPTLDDIGITSVDLMSGGESEQILVSNIGKIPATAKEIDYTVPKDVGPPGDSYFIKFTAGTYSSYSGTFTIANVNGKLGTYNPGSSNATNVTGTPLAPSATSTPTPNTSDTSSKTGASTTKSPLPTPLSSINNAANLLPSFVGIATTAAALALTYLC